KASLYSSCTSGGSLERRGSSLPTAGVPGEAGGVGEAGGGSTARETADGSGGLGRGGGSLVTVGGGPSSSRGLDWLSKAAMRSSRILICGPEPTRSLARRSRR